VNGCVYKVVSKCATRIDKTEEINLLKISDIKIGPRFRKELGDLKALKQSIQEIGLFHPPVVNENNELIAGYRRIQAYKELGHQEIPVTRINLQDIVNGEVHENIFIR
jgi:ParB-like chromosome segregation protein Spo0J